MRYLYILSLAALASIASADIYGVKSAAGAPSTTPSRLFRFDDSGSSFTDIGTIQVNGQAVDVDGLAMDSSGGLFGFSLSGGASTLISINSANGVATAIGTMNKRQIRGAMFNDLHRLIALDSATNSVFQVDLSSGEQLSGSALTFNGNPFDLSDTTDIVQRGDGSYIIVDDHSFYELDLSSGALALLHNDIVDQPEPGVFMVANAGLAVSEVDSALLWAYEVNGQDDLFTYESDAGFSRALGYGDIINSFNSGRGDLASRTPVPEPAAVFALSLGAASVIRRRLRKREPRNI